MQLRRLLLTGTSLALLAVAVPAQDCSNPQPGPDVIVGSLPSITNYGGTGGIGGYSLGTTSCNVGTTTLKWVAGTVEHPVIGQNFYRLENGRFEQIGMSWLKHGFTALQGNVCCNCTPHPNGTALGVGCSDPYSSSLNGSQGGLGPRFQVNAYTGAFSYPFFAQGQGGNQIYKRAQIAGTDLDPSLHPTALYFGEGHYIAADDAAAGNGANNASYRPVQVGSFTSGSWNLSTTGTTMRTRPALRAWSDTDPDVKFVIGRIPDEGTFFAASDVTDNGDGTWHYEYAIQNLSSDISIGSFGVPLPAGAVVSNIGFKDIEYHSGEPWDGTDWVSQQVGGELVWSTAETFAQNANANALRWGTLYNFWFDADVAPGVAHTNVDFFKPHSTPGMTVKLDVPLGDGTWEDLGGGSNGVTGQPVLTMTGPLTPGSSVTLSMVNGAPGALAVALLSSTSTPTPLLGGVIHPFPWSAAIFQTTSGAGGLGGSVTFSGAPAGTELFFQVAVEDNSVPIHSVALSNGVKGTVP